VDGTGTEVLVNDRLDVVIAAGAAGVHLPASGLAPSDARAAFAGRIGVSTHFSGEVAGLAPGATDFATFGPVFDTASKRRYGPPVGLDALRAAVAASRVPVYAIGGITEATASLVAGAGIAGIAGIKSVLAAPDPGRAAAAVIRAAFPGLP
jgi:thiamine-phosphate pyrophosphorylase